MEINPDYADAWLGKGDALSNSGKYDQVIECYDKAIKLDPNNADTWLSRGLALFNFKRYYESIECYDKALEINPRYSLALNNKANDLVRLNKYPEVLGLLTIFGNVF